MLYDDKVKQLRMRRGYGDTKEERWKPLARRIARSTREETRGFATQVNSAYQEHIGMAAKQKHDRRQ